MKRRSTIFAALLAALLCGLGSCTLDYCEGEKGLPFGNGQTREVSLSLRLRPQTDDRPATYADNASEQRIDEVMVLLFHGTDEDALLYGVSEGTVSAEGGPLLFETRFAVDRRFERDPFACVVLANARGRTLVAEAGGPASLTAETLRGYIGTASYAALQGMLTEPVNGPLHTGQEAFAMFGRSAQPFVPASGSATLDVLLLRSVARANLLIAETASAFSLSEVYLYRPSDRLALMPSASALGSGESVVRSPSLPEGTSSAPIGSPWRYEASGPAFTQRIYLPEADLTGGGTAPLPGDERHTERCALVVGGSYRGSTSYYRIDFQQDGRMLDLLRNHSYNITVTAVRSAGEATPEEAYRSRRSNIDAEIIPWTDSNQEIVFDGENWASVSRKRIDFADGKGTEALLGLLSNIAPSEWTMSLDDGEASSEEQITGTHFSVSKPADAAEDAAQQGGNLVIRTLHALSSNEEQVQQTLTVRIGRLELSVLLVQHPYEDTPWEDGGDFEGEF